jgi:hypothetical protein
MLPRTRAALLLAALAAGFALARSNLPLRLPTTCPFRLLTGCRCGACGMTHAFCNLAHARFTDALHDNLASPLLALALAALAALLAAELLTNKNLVVPAWKRARPLWLTCGFAIFVIGALGHLTGF